MDDDVFRSSTPQDSEDGDRQALHSLRQRLSDALIRLSQIDEPQPQALEGGSWNTRSLSLSHETVAGSALTQAISLMSARVPVWDASYMRLVSQTLQALGSRPSNGGTFTVDAATMCAASHAIEDHALKARLDCELYVGFQRLTLLRSQLGRYTNLLDCARYVYVFGIDDIPPGAPVFRHPHLIRFIITPQGGAGLLWFWFLLVNHPNFSTVLLARQVSGELFHRHQHVRTYQGFWSFDRAVVEEIMRVLREAGRSLFYGSR